MPTNIPTNLNVRGPLDTSNPKAGAAPGTLLEATDVAHRWWGPRQGHKMLTWPLEQNYGSPGQGFNLATFASGIYLTGQIMSSDHDFKDDFTLDFTILPTATPSNGQVVAEWRIGTAADLELRWHASTSGLLQVFLNSTEFLTSTTACAHTGTDELDIIQYRVVRAGTNAYLYVNGQLEDTATGLASSKIVFPTSANQRGGWRIGGTGGGLDLKILTFVFRRNPYNQAPQLASHYNPRAPDVVLALDGSVTGSYMRDLSAWGSHGLFTGSPASAIYVDTPHIRPAQGFSAFDGRRGFRYDAVMCGGQLNVAKR